MRIKSSFSALILICGVQFGFALPQVEDAGDSLPASSPSQNSSSNGYLASTGPIASTVGASTNTLPKATINDELLTRLRALEQQVQELQGRVDELQHALKQHQSEQAQEFLILNKKLAELPKSSTATVQASAPVKNTSTTVVAAPKKSADSSVPLAPDAQEKATYDAAYGLVSAKAYSDAIEAFEGYLSIYPSGKYTANAYYWLAELQANQQAYPSALKNLQIIVDNYPQSPKAADALLKLGMINQRMGDAAKAKQWFERLVKEYPDSKSARSAKQYISG